MDSRPSFKGIQCSIFLVSAVLIAYEILLVRFFSIQYWYHFASLIISVALLGFGASGTCIFFFSRTLKSSISAVFHVVPLLLCASIWINVHVSRVVAFNPLMILWQVSEIRNLIILVSAMFVPFFLGALCIGMGFLIFSGDAHRVYFANLLGSGVGALLILLTIFHVSPYEIIFVLSVMAIAASFPMAEGRFRKAGSSLMLIVLIPLYYTFLQGTLVPMNPYKDLSRAGQLRDSKREFQQFGSLGLVTVIDSPAYHYLPDLSLNCPHPLPAQKGLFLDGNTVGAINGFSGSMDDLECMECRTASLAYELLENPAVLIIGGGGGTEILNARYHRARSVSVVEINGDIVRLMRHRYGPYSGGVYNTLHGSIFIEDGRGYLQRVKEKYDLIQLSVPESMELASSGVYSLNENYLLTTEALEACMRHLNPGGMISISRWVKNPPRENVKLLAMAVDALEAQGKKPSESIIMIRSWQVATILIKNGAVTADETALARTFCARHRFDPCYFPGITREETNGINRMDKSYFYIAAKRLLSRDRGTFYRDYPFDIRPATDDRPFFAHSFKGGIFKRYLSSEGRAMIPFVDWGYVLLWISFLVLIFFSIIFIAVPLGVADTRKVPTAGILVYFGSLGAAYMFLEISFLHQFVRYLYDPVFSATIVISSFLVYSGLGSLMGGKIRKMRGKHVPAVIVIIVIVGIAYLAADSLLHHTVSRVSLGARMLICSALVAPLAIPMGIPFPSGIVMVRRIREDLIPWAWCINGFFSVIGATAAVLLAISVGFTMVILCALGLYALAGIVCMVMNSGSPGEGFSISP